MNNVILTATHDTSVARAYVALTEKLYISNPDTLIPLCNKAIEIVERNLSSSNKQEKQSFLFTKAAALNNIAYVYYVKGNMQVAIDYFNQALKINEEINATKEIANSLSNIGALYDQIGEPQKALNYLTKALKIQESDSNKMGQAYSINNIAAIYDKQGQMQKALEFMHKGLKIQEELQNKHGIATALNNLGAFYVKQSQFEKALEYYHKSLTIRKEIDDKYGIATSYHNIAYVHNQQNNPEKSLEFDSIAHSIYTKIGDKRGIANTLHNMAAVFKEKSDYTTAVEYYNKSIALYREIGDKRGLANSLNNLGEIMVTTGQVAEAKKYVNEALESASEGQYIEPMRTAFYNLSIIDSLQGNYKSAYSNYKQYIIYRDSISNQNTRKLALKKQFQYEYEKKEETLKSEQEKQKAIQAEELKRQKTIYWSSAGILVLVFLLILLLTNSYRLKQKNKLQLQLNRQEKEAAKSLMETQENERKRIAEDLHDSLGHLLSTAKLNLQQEKIEKSQINNSLELINQASDEIRNVIFNLMPATLEEEGLILALRELVKKVTNSGRVKVFLHVHNMEKFQLEKQSEFNIYRIIQEAVNNILKHANATEINIQLIGRDNHISIMIEDDGKGFNPESNKKGRGLKNIVTRSLWLKGNINIDSMPGKGTTITTEFPA